MDTVLALQESVLSYLDRSGGLLKLSEDCEPYNGPQQSEAVYRFCVSVDPSDAVELDPLLGHCVLHEPRRATRLFQSVCFAAIKTLGLVEKIHTENQYTLDLCAFPRGYGPMRPRAMEGAVISVTRVTKYTQGARFLCTEEDCPGSTGFYHIRVHAPGATESATVRNDFSCLICSSPLKEDVKFRVLGDKQLVELIHVKALGVLSVRPQSSPRYQSVTVFLRDELCNSMRLGQFYKVLGIPAHVHQWPNITWSVEASSVQPWEPIYPHQISDNFQTLLRACACSPWRFAAMVANSFGSAVVPPGLYNSLKLSLLLSLVQTTGNPTDICRYLDLLVLTSDTLIVDRLLAYSLSLAGRGVRHQASGEMFAFLSRDKHGTGTANIHAGSALLATGGICMLGDLGGYRRDKLDAIQSVLEGRAVPVFIPGKKYGEDADQKLCFPVQCSFWALADSTEASQRSSRIDFAVLGAAEMGPVPAQLAEVFGLVVQCVDTLGGETVLAQTVHTIRQAVQPGEPLYPSCAKFPTKDYQELLSHARGLKVELTPGAERMIHSYYMASRRVRSGQNQGIKVSMASIKLLISLAEAHCKLSLRTRVLEHDAVIAVLLCENSITLRHGSSALVIPPDAVFPCDLCDLEALKRRELTLEKLQQNILHFIYTYAPGSDSYITEE